MFKVQLRCAFRTLFVEAEYAFTQHKDIVPLMMESNYRPDGWLGIIIGSKLWIDFSRGQIIRDSVEKLKKELGNYLNPASVRQHKRVLREIQGIQVKFSYQKCFRTLGFAL